MDGHGAGTATQPDGAATGLGRPRAWLVTWLQLFALSGFAIAYPVFDLLGSNGTFFVVHDTTGAGLVLFALVVLLVPPTVLLGVLALVHLVRRSLDEPAMAVLVGALAALFLVPAIDRAVDLGTIPYFVLLVAVGVGAGVLYFRRAGFRTFATYLSPAPVIFAVVFLFISPVSALLSPDEPGALAEFGGAETPVVVLVFDELPLGTLVDEQGNLDTERLPGFAELATEATWYPQATTVAGSTYVAVPAIQTGTVPEWGTIPIASEYPHSLFTMLGGSHEVRATERVTRVCPSALCEDAGATEEADASLTKDSVYAYLHSVLPSGLESAWLPPIGNTWAGFGEEGVDDAADLAAADDLDAKEWAEERREIGAGTAIQLEQPRFIESIRKSKRPGVWYQHYNTPHIPLAFLPDGRTYTRGWGTGLTEDLGSWAHDPDLIEVARAQFMLQVGYVDHLVSEAVHRLKEQGMWEEALFAVVSDHGLTFDAGRHRRGRPIDDANLDEILPVAMFVKYPGQTEGSIDRRPAQTTDLLPTIADSLGVELPSDWELDGLSLLGDVDEDRERILVDSEEGGFTGGERKEQPRRARPEVMAREMRAVLGDVGDGRDLYRVGPYGDLVGQEAAPLVGGDVAGAGVRLDDPAQYDAVVLDAPAIPAFFGATVDGLTPDDWVAVAIDGTIAGVGPVADVQGSRRVAAILDPSLLHDGRNDVTVYAVRDGGRTLEAVDLRR